MKDPPNHQIVVFSIINDDDSVKVKFVQCENCGIVHKVTEIGKSEVLPRETMISILSIDDIRTSIPPQLATILEGNRADLPTWEAAQFILENKRWGEFVVLSTDSEGGTKQGKYLRILGENLFKVEGFVREDS